MKIHIDIVIERGGKKHHYEFPKPNKYKEDKSKTFAGKNERTEEQETFDKPFIPPILPPEEKEEVVVVETNSNLVLFIQAESGMQLLQKIKANNKLLPDFSNDLYLYAMRLWVGSEAAFNRNSIKLGFMKNANSGVVPKNDFVMLRFEFDNTYKGFEKNAKDYERMDFFNAICKDKLALIQISERLAFDDSKGMGSWER